MGQPLLQSSLNAGELSPALYGRTDFAKYHQGLALCRNFFVDQRGGVINRSGTKFIGPVANSANITRLIPFIFSTTQTYALEFGNLTIRFITNGGYVTEATKAITGVTQANPGVVTSAAHGYSNGDDIFVTGVVGMTQLNGRFLTVANATTNTYTLLDMFGNAVDTTSYTAYSSGGTSARIYTVVSPYASADLALVKFTQSSDVMTLCHPNYAPQQLTRYGNTNWAITAITFGPTIPTPTNSAATPKTAGGTGYSYVVTAIINNIESRQSNIAAVASVTLSTTANSYINVSWNAVTGATQYFIYRTREIASVAATVTGAEFGYIGSCTGNLFQDGSILPDFTRRPPQATNPFTGGNSFASVTVSAGGAGYTSPTLTVTDATGTGATFTVQSSAGVITGATVVTPGTNYTSSPILTLQGGAGSGASASFNYDNSGVITSVTMVSGGTGYTNPVAKVKSKYGTGAVLTPIVGAGIITGITVTNGGTDYGFNGPDGQDYPSIKITDQGGSGAVLVANLTPVLNNPSCCCYYQQRLAFGATLNNPDEIVMSKTGDYNNMDVSYVTQDDDAITITIASQTQNAIKSLVPFNSMLALSSNTCWKIDAGVNGGPLTPASVNAIPQSFEGASDVPPVIINYSILYVQDKQSAVQDVAFSFYQNLYTGNDLSTLANHLFGNRIITEWAWAQEPHKVMWCVRDDGIALTLTYVKQQEIYAWARHDMINGLIKSVCTIPEGKEDAIYFVVQRVINGVTVQYTERMQSRLLGGDAATGIPGSLDACWFVDCGLQTSLTYPAATLTVVNATAGTFTQSANVLTSGNVGEVLRVNGGQGVITAVSGASITATINQPLTSTWPAASGSWSSTPTVTTVSGLEHLNGQTVSILADGNVQPQRVVANGAITLDNAASLVTVGLPITAQGKTMPLDTGENPTMQTKRVHVNAVTARVRDSRGLQIGHSFNDLYEIKERSFEAMGQPIQLLTKDERIVLDPLWETPTQVCFQQVQPLPASVQALVFEMTEGDSAK